MRRHLSSSSQGCIGPEWNFESTSYILFKFVLVTLSLAVQLNFLASFTMKCESLSGMKLLDFSNEFKVNLKMLLC